MEKVELDQNTGNKCRVRYKGNNILRESGEGHGKENVYRLCVLMARYNGCSLNKVAYMFYTRV